MKRTFTGILNFRKMEDGGQALLTEFDEQECTPESETMFVRVQSWIEGNGEEITKESHTEILPFLGKRVKITVETIDE